MKSQCFLDQHRLEFLIPGGPGPVQRQGKAEGGLVVGTDPDRVEQVRQPAAIPVGHDLDQGGQGGAPALGPRVVPFAQFHIQLKQPGQAIGAFIGGPALALEISHFADHGVGIEIGVQCGCCCLGQRIVRILTQQADDQPVAMHGRMPVIATVKGRMEFARGKRVRIRLQHVGDLVRVFALHTVEGKLEKVLILIRHGLVSLCLSDVAAMKRKNRNGTQKCSR